VIKEIKYLADNKFVFLSSFTFWCFRTGATWEHRVWLWLWLLNWKEP